MTVVIYKKKCLACGGCVGLCPFDALNLEEGRDLQVNNKCTDCNICVKFCPVGALKIENKK